MAANEHSLPRLHLIGTLTIVMMLTVALGGYFSWRSAQEHQASIERVAQVLRAQQQERLQRELDSAISFLEFTRQRTDTVLRASLREQVDVAMQMVQAIHARESQRHPPEVVKRLIIEALRPVRFYQVVATISSTTCRGASSCCRPPRSSKAGFSQTTRTTAAT